MLRTGLLLAVVVAACSSCGTDRSQDDSPEYYFGDISNRSDLNSDLSAQGLSLCSDVIVGGTISKISKISKQGDRTVTTIRVSDWVKPVSGPRVTEVETGRLGYVDFWTEGRQVGIATDIDPDGEPLVWMIAERGFERMRRATRAVSKTNEKCPYPAPTSR